MPNDCCKKFAEREVAALAQQCVYEHQRAEQETAHADQMEDERCKALLKLEQETKRADEAEARLAAYRYREAAHEPAAEPDK